MSDQHRTWHPGRQQGKEYNSDQWVHPNAFGQPERDRYEAHDPRPFQTGNVSWKAEQNHRGKGPKGYVRSDERIRDDVHHRLTEDDAVDASEIEVQVANAEVTLNGTVPDRESRRRAEDVVDGISGINHVQNNLRVKKEGSSGPSGSGPDRDTERNSAGTAGTRNVEVM